MLQHSIVALKKDEFQGLGRPTAKVTCSFFMHNCPTRSGEFLQNVLQVPHVLITRLHMPVRVYVYMCLQTWHTTTC